MPTLPPGSKWNGQEPKHFSIPLSSLESDKPPTHLKCSRTHCVISLGKTVFVYSIPNFSLIHTLQHAYEVIGMDFDDDILVTISEERSIRAFYLVTGKCEATADGSEIWENDHGVYCTIAKRGQGDNDHGRLHTLREKLILLMPFLGRAFYIWRLRYSGDRTLSTSSHLMGRYEALQRVENGGHQTRCLEALGMTAATGGYDGTVRTWDLTSGDCEWTLIGHRYIVTQVCLDESRIYSGSSDRTVRVWDRHIGECLHILQSSKSSPWGLRVSPTYLTAMYNLPGLYSIARVWDCESGKLIFQPTGSFVSPAHLDDQKLILLEREGLYPAVSSSTREDTHHQNRGRSKIQIVDIQTNQVVQILVTRNKEVSKITAQGQFCVALADAGTAQVHVWSLEIWNFGVDDDDEGWVEKEQGSRDAEKAFAGLGAVGVEALKRKASNKRSNNASKRNRGAKNRNEANGKA